MKIKSILVPLLIVIIIASSCTKTVTKIVVDNVTITDTVTVNALQMPVQSIIAIGKEADTGYLINLSLEVGNEFFASDSGVITQLGGLLSAKNTVYTVSLWNVTSTNLLAQTTITTTDTTKFAYATITPVNISPNTPYMITFNSSPSGNFLAYQLKTGPTVYPFSSGNITFTDAYYTISTTSVFPTTVQPDYLIPVDFVFQTVK
jgi:hypothetical protein